MERSAQFVVEKDRTASTPVGQTQVKSWVDELLGVAQEDDEIKAISILRHKFIEDSICRELIFQRITKLQSPLKATHYSVLLYLLQMAISRSSRIASLEDAIKNGLELDMVYFLTSALRNE